ncbi:MAG: hypothetical protein VW257_12215 [Quisquiliibacterium sp.]
MQRWLQRVYEIDVTLDVMDFVITDQTLVQALQGNAQRAQCKEKLLLSQSSGELEMSLYLAPDVLDACSGAAQGLQDEKANAWCQAIEGVSHFLYLAWRAGFERELTELELELQAEIDKFIGLASMGGATEFNKNASICSWLFEGVSYEDGLAADARARYEAANFYASQYCRQLNERYVRVHDGPGLTRELRRFYRQDQRGKLDMIHT